MAPNQAKKKVGEFIQQHPFISVCSQTFTTSQRRTFVRDVYDYSRALGLSPVRSQKQVDKVREICGKQLRRDDDSAWEGEIDDGEAIRRLLCRKARVGVEGDIGRDELEPQSTASQKDGTEAPGATPDARRSKSEESKPRKAKKRKMANDNAARNEDQIPVKQPRSLEQSDKNMLAPRTGADVMDLQPDEKVGQGAGFRTSEGDQRRTQQATPGPERQKSLQSEHGGHGHVASSPELPSTREKALGEPTATSSKESAAAPKTPYMALWARMREQKDNDAAPEALGSSQDQENKHGSAEPSLPQDQEHGDAPARTTAKRKRQSTHGVQQEADRRRKSFLSELMTQTMGIRNPPNEGDRQEPEPANVQATAAAEEILQQPASAPKDEVASRAKASKKENKQTKKNPKTTVGSDQSSIEQRPHDKLADTDFARRGLQEPRSSQDEIAVKTENFEKSKFPPAAQSETSNHHKSSHPRSIPFRDSHPTQNLGSQLAPELWSSPTMRAMDEASKSPLYERHPAPRPMHATAKPIGSSGRQPQSQGLESRATLLNSSPSRRKTTRTMSQFFQKDDAQNASCLTFPSLTAPAFGLVQERLARQPFQLLVAVILLNKTRGSVAVPACDRLFQLYPSAVHMVKASVEDIVDVIGNLGLQQKRAQTILDLARTWLKTRPRRGLRYRLLNYPLPGSGKNISSQEEPIAEEDPRDAWEVAHLPGVGVYAIDSWRIFCRDALRQRSNGMQPLGAAGAAGVELAQEWTAVLPKDKELRAYLQWRWLRLGFLWDFQSGEKVRIGPDVIAKLEKKEIKSYFGFKNPWLMDFMVTEETPDFALEGGTSTGNPDNSLA